MKKFTFKLQKLLDIRTHKEKLIKNELAKAQSERYLIVRQRERLADEYSEGVRKMGEEVKHEMLAVETLYEYQRYFKRLKEQIASKLNLIGLADERIKLINDRLVEARKEKRILERLKEKKWKEYQYELQREEQAFFDEVGTNTFIRKMRHEEIKEKIEIPMTDNKEEKETDSFFE
ncbi:MAG: flagellar export protein FliJ [bacterium]|nr:flagellar export protein FliJ [bacterium]